MGFGIEIVFIVTLGLLVFGPKGLLELLGHVARAKAQFDNATLGLKSQLGKGLEASSWANEEEDSSETVGDR